MDWNVRKSQQGKIVSSFTLFWRIFTTRKNKENVGCPVVSTEEIIAMFRKKMSQIHTDKDKNPKKWNRAWLLFVDSLGCRFLYSESISENYFVEIFCRKCIRNVKVENPGFLPTRSWSWDVCAYRWAELDMHSVNYYTRSPPDVQDSRIEESCCVKGVRKPW